MTVAEPLVGVEGELTFGDAVPGMARHPAWSFADVVPVKPPA
jgi:hypothetical protein